MKIFEIKDLSFGYDNSLILRNVNLDIKEKDFIILTGNNGSGKSTLIKLLNGTLKNYIGSIKIFNKDIKEFDSWEKIGYVPQIDRDNITNFPISVQEMILLSLYYDFNFLNQPRKKHHKMVGDIMSTFNILNLKDKNFNELSGGQKQRVMIAKAMVHNPEVLILDEPTVGIDKESRELFYNLLNHMFTHHNITIILVTHESDIKLKEEYRKILVKEKELKEYV